MSHPLRRQNVVATYLISACLVVLSTASVCAQSFQEVACYVFAGNEQCQTVSIVDPEICTIKIRPRPLANLDPSIAGCLLDDIETKKFFPGNARLEKLLFSNTDRAGGITTSKSTLEIAGHEVVQILTEYDDNGAPVWEPKNSYTFELNGDLARTKKSLEHLSVCGRQATASKRAGNARPRVIGVNEAFKLAAAGDILLIDIRHESEWRRTGIGVNAIPITVHQNIDDFVKQLGELVGADKHKPLALICAEGVRSTYLQTALEKQGFPRVLDVHEGMLGGPPGPGWIKSGLPTKPYRSNGG